MQQIPDPPTRPRPADFDPRLDAHLTSSHVVIEKEGRGWFAQLCSAAVYLGVGALAHFWQLGDTFNVHSVASWGWLLAWPVGLVVIFLKWALVVTGVMICALVAYLILYWSIPAVRHHLARAAREGRSR